MTVLAPPRHPLIDQALADARRWCSGHIIDARPAIAHAARVATTVASHEPAAPATVIAAALLHDSPEFAPTDLDLDQVLLTCYGPDVHRLVRGMQREHEALDSDRPVVLVDDRQLLLLSTSDKVVALTSAARRARRSGDPAAFFAARQPLVRLLPHFRSCCEAAKDRVPTTLTADLCAALDELDHLITSVSVA